MVQKGEGPAGCDGKPEKVDLSLIESARINSTSPHARKAARERLPDRRASEGFEINVSGRKYRCTISRFSDGRLAEIFISNNKSGSDSDCAARDSAVVCSIAIQYGAPLDVIRKALMRDSRGRPNGPLGAALDHVATSSNSHGGQP